MPNEAPYDPFMCGPSKIAFIHFLNQLSPALKIYETKIKTDPQSKEVREAEKTITNSLPSLFKASILMIHESDFPIYLGGGKYDPSISKIEAFPDTKVEYFSNLNLLSSNEDFKKIDSDKFVYVNTNPYKLEGIVIKMTTQGMKTFDNTLKKEFIVPGIFFAGNLGGYTFTKKDGKIIWAPKNPVLIIPKDKESQNKFNRVIEKQVVDYFTKS